MAEVPKRLSEKADGMIFSITLTLDIWSWNVSMITLIVCLIHLASKRVSRKSEVSDEFRKKDGKQEKLPGDLTGTLQSLFTQTEQAEAPALKPLRRPKVNNKVKMISITLLN